MLNLLSYINFHLNLDKNIVFTQLFIDFIYNIKAKSLKINYY
jgi:hypothetical protein